MTYVFLHLAATLGGHELILKFVSSSPRWGGGEGYPLVPQVFSPQVVSNMDIHVPLNDLSCLYCLSDIPSDYLETKKLYLSSSV